MLTWRSGGVKFGLLLVLGVGLCARAQAQGGAARLLARLWQLTGGGPAAPMSVLNARSLASTPTFVTTMSF